MCFVCEFFTQVRIGRQECRNDAFGAVEPAPHDVVYAELPFKERTEVAERCAG
jgi:hypothetical protein